LDQSQKEIHDGTDDPQAPGSGGGHRQREDHPGDQQADLRHRADLLSLATCCRVPCVVGGMDSRACRHPFAMLLCVSPFQRAVAGPQGPARVFDVDTSVRAGLVISSSGLCVVVGMGCGGSRRERAKDENPATGSAPDDQAHHSQSASTRVFRI